MNTIHCTDTKQFVDLIEFAKKTHCSKPKIFEQNKSVVAKFDSESIIIPFKYVEADAQSKGVDTKSWNLEN